MASNEISDSHAALVSLAEDAADGAAAFGVAIGLQQNTEARIRADLVALNGDPQAVPPIPGKQAEYAAAKTAKTTTAALERTAVSNGRATLAHCVDALKKPFGRAWNSQWQQAGFVNHSLAIPDDPLPLLNALAAFFTANPAFENAPGGATQAACAAAADAVSTARSTANAAVATLGLKKQERDTAFRALYKRLSGLLAELGQLLEDNDPRWYNFGFDAPGAGQQPGPVLELLLTPGGPGMIFADWSDARRATRYRVFKQIPGVNPAFVQVENSVTESEHTLTGLPSGAQALIRIIPVNDAGDGPETTSQPLTVP